jgi:hypothetical protein
MSASTRLPPARTSTLLRKGDEQKEPPGGVGDPEPADHTLRRSRGGWTTKVHLATEQAQKPLSLVVTAGQRGDSPQFQVVLAVSGSLGWPLVARVRPDRVLADKAYGSRANRGYLRRRGIRCTIPEKTDQVRHRKNRGRAGGRPPPSTRRSTSNATRWSVGSTGSSATVLWPPDTTSSPCGRRPRSRSPRSTSGYDFETRPSAR